MLYVHLTLFSVVKSLIITKSLYYDNSLTDGITVTEEGSLFLIDTYTQCGLVVALEATWDALGESESATQWRQGRMRKPWISINKDKSPRVWRQGRLPQFFIPVFHSWACLLPWEATQRPYNKNNLFYLNQMNGSYTSGLTKLIL